MKPTVTIGSTNLAQTSYLFISVPETWLDPCHILMYNRSASASDGFNSGAFNIDSNPAATPTTWAANDLKSACPTSFTGGTAVVTVTDTLPATATASQSTSGGANSTAGGSNSTSCDLSSSKASQKNSSPSFGAGIGVGVTIGVVLGAATALGWWLLNKRGNQAAPTEVGGQQSSTGIYDGENKNGAYYGNGLQVAPSELASEGRTSELP
jgi:hypothetical protein